MIKHLSVLLFLISSQCLAQNLDSLFSVWENNKQHDTLRLQAFNEYISSGFLFTQPDSAFKLAHIQFEFAQSKGYKKYTANAIRLKGVSCAVRGLFDDATIYFKDVLVIDEEIGDKEDMAGTLNNIGNICLIQSDYNQAILYYKKGLTIREEINNKEGIAASLSSIGGIYFKQANYTEAMRYEEKSLGIRLKTQDYKGISTTYHNMASIFQMLGNYSKAINLYRESLNLSDQDEDKESQANTLNNIGVIYRKQKEYTKALDHYEKALNIYLDIQNLKGQSDAYLNIGVIYKNLENYEKALEYYSKSLELDQQMKDKSGVVTCLNNIGRVYKAKKDFTKAIEFFNRGLKIGEEIEDNNSIFFSLSNLTQTYSSMGEFNKANSYTNRLYSLAKVIDSPISLRDASSTLYELYKLNGNYNKALEMYELYVQMRDSIQNEENLKEIIRHEYRYSYEKQAVADSITNEKAQKVKDALLAAEKAENIQHQLEAKQQHQLTYFLFGGLGLAILFGGAIFNRFRVTNKQKSVIEAQKKKVDKAFDELEEKNTEIMDSINYAKRIQSAILPPNKVVKEYLQKSFILYKPKDIVAGDFYWLEHKNNKVLFAAADCTGHGVPGAMVSVICNNGLNRSVREHNLTDPGEILDKTREIVIQEFEKSEDEVKDGMDIALCSLSTLRVPQGAARVPHANQETVAKLQYAGAHNPLWIIRKGEILETKANKQPIGKFDSPQPYTTHTFELQKGDTIYIFSDGYVDQFGGDRGKKFKSKAFRTLLLSIQNNPMEEQKQLIDEAFENWRGDLEQIDDVCVIGVRV